MSRVPSTGDRNRKLRNFLLDPAFQLKTAAYAVVLTLAVSAFLGVFLYQTTQSLFDETNKAVEARERAARTSKELGNATLANQLLEHMQDPAFEGQLKEKSAAIDRAYEQEAQAISKAREHLVAQQTRTLYVLVGGLVALAGLVGLGAIVFTHRVVGPLLRVKRIAQEVREGRLSLPTHGLRPGDEFQDVFEALTLMLESLRAHELATAQALAQLAANAPADPAAARALKDLEDHLRKRVA